MKLTDEKVAKALGWTLKKGRTVAGRTSYYWTFPGAGRGNSQKYPPCYTTQTDLCIEAVQELGLNLHLHQWPTKWEAALYKDHLRVDGQGHWGKTAPLALCAALLAYLKEKP